MRRTPSAMIVACSGENKPGDDINLYGVSQDNFKLAQFFEHKNIKVSPWSESSARLTRVAVRDRMAAFFQQQDITLFIVSFSGPGHPGTGDWQLLDGVLSLEDVLRLWVGASLEARSDARQRRELLLLCLCCYSGCWVERQASLRCPGAAIQTACKGSGDGSTTTDCFDEMFVLHWLDKQRFTAEAQYDITLHRPQVYIPKESATMEKYFEFVRDPQDAIVRGSSLSWEDARTRLQTQRGAAEHLEASLGLRQIVFLVAAISLVAVIRGHDAPLVNRTSPHYWVAVSTSSGMALAQAVLPWTLVDALVPGRAALLWWTTCFMICTLFRSGQWWAAAELQHCKNCWIIAWTAANDVAGLWAPYVYFLIRHWGSRCRFDLMAGLVLALFTCSDLVSFTMGRYTIGQMDVKLVVAVALSSMSMLLLAVRYLNPMVAATWTMVVAYILTWKASWDIAVTAQLLVQEWARAAGWAYFGRPALFAHAAVVLLVDWCATHVVHNLSLRAPPEGADRLRVLLLFPMLLGTSNFAALLFLNTALSASTMTVLLYIVLSLPTHLWRGLALKGYVCILHCVGWVGTIEARQQLQLHDEHGMTGFELDRAAWLMAHVRFRAQQWGVALALCAVAVDYAQDQKPWFCNLDKRPRGLAIAHMWLLVMLLVSCAGDAALRWYMSKRAVRDGVLLREDRGSDPAVVLPKMLRQQLPICGTLLMASAVTLSVYKVDKIQAAATGAALL